MKPHLANAAFGAIDYLAYPMGMLLLAPIILHSLGIERYGIWILANAALSVGAILASGFGDANIQSVAAALGDGKSESPVDTVSSALAIHIALGTIAAIAGWLIAPVLTHSAIRNSPALANDCLWSLRVTAILIFIRAVETVCVSTQRAYSRYGSAIQISAVARLLCLIAAVLTSFCTHSVSAAMISSLVISSIAATVQFRQLSNLLNIAHLRPRFHRGITKALLRFGVFTWLQAASGLLFGQVDRIIAAMTFGAAAAASYSFCVQLAMPIYGLSAAGLHFVFPLLASQHGGQDATRARRSIFAALSVNIVFVAVALTAMLLFGRTFLRIWAGTAIASTGGDLLSPLVWSSALSALGVTGCYSMLAVGKPRVVTFLNITGGVVMLASIALLIPHYGIAGIAYGRMLFGPVVLLIYVPLLKIFTRSAGQFVVSDDVPIYEDA